MKRFILSIVIICLLAIPAPASARMKLLDVTPVGGQAATGWNLLWTENFEAIADGEEWSNDGNWFENPASNNEFVGDDAYYQAGSLSGLDVGTANTNFIYRVFTKSNDTVRVDVIFRVDTTKPTGQHWVYVTTDGIGDANKIWRLTFDAGSDIDDPDNAQVVANASWAVDTWYAIVITVDTSVSGGQDCINAYFGLAANLSGDTAPFGLTASANNPFDTFEDRDPGTLQRIYLRSTGEAAINYDNISIYDQ